MNDINQDIKEQFASIKKNVLNQLEKDFDIDHTISHLSSYIPKEVIFKSEQLLETLLSYLMKDAQSAINQLDVKTKNKFYDEKLNEKIIEFANNLKEDKNLISNAIEFQKDNRKLNAFIASGTTFIVGALGINAIVSTSVISLIVSGIVVIAVAAFVFKLTYNKVATKTRINIREDVKNYLEKTEKEVDFWLNEVTIAFNKELQSFIKKNSTLNQASK